VTETGSPRTWITAWEAAQRELERLAGRRPQTPEPAVAAAHRRLADFARDYAELAAAAYAQWQPGEGPFNAQALPIMGRYEHLFTPHGLAVALAQPAAANGGEMRSRAQRAAERYGRLAASIAADAGRRLGAALTAAGEGAPPITSLRELHALWIECGEAAWAAAVHREEFAEAQAELLAAFVELRAGTAPA
jgi:Poly(R)-hydroxyalkanoic acid synthase subunit (PHA_synth_III_E)